MTKSILFLIALGVSSALVLSTAPAAAQGRGHGQAQKPAKPAKPAKIEAKHTDNNKKHTGDNKTSRDTAVDRDGHARVIHEYARAGSLPPGLAERQALPPGLAKQLRERGELPSGLQKHLVAVPEPWARRLPPVPSYYRRYFAGDDLVIVDTRTNRIASLIRDALR